MVRSVKRTKIQDSISIKDIPLLLYANLKTGVLLKRYKRFLADVELEEPESTKPSTEGQHFQVVYCPNTGPMTGLLDRARAPVLLSSSEDSKRKYRNTLEWIQPEANSSWVGIHSANANKMAAALLENHLLDQLGEYTTFDKEVKYGKDGKSRVDFVLHRPSGRQVFVEVKSVTMAQQVSEGTGRVALFPDTVSTRAQRHARELTAQVAQGHEAVMLFIVQRSDCIMFAPCQERDPLYAALVREAHAAGVQVMAVQVDLMFSPGTADCVGQEAAVLFGGTMEVNLIYATCG